MFINSQALCCPGFLLAVVLGHVIQSGSGLFFIQSAGWGGGRKKKKAQNIGGWCGVTFLGLCRGWFGPPRRVAPPIAGSMKTMLSAAAAERNKEPILAVLRASVATEKPLQALEISSGTGQHVTHFAQALPNIMWQPSEYDQQSMAR